MRDSVLRIGKQNFSLIAGLLYGVTAVLAALCIAVLVHQATGSLTDEVLLLALASVVFSIPIGACLGSRILHEDLSQSRCAALGMLVPLLALLAAVSLLHGVENSSATSNPGFNLFETLENIFRFCASVVAMTFMIQLFIGLIAYPLALISTYFLFAISCADSFSAPYIFGFPKPLESDLTTPFQR